MLDLGGTFDRGEDVVLRPDGRIVVAGPTNRAGNFDFAVAQVLNPQGTFDPSFGGGGFGNLDFAAGGGSGDSAQGVVLQPDGKVILAGYTNANATQDLGVARTTAGGMLDFGYGASGISFTNFGADEYGTTSRFSRTGRSSSRAHTILPAPRTGPSPSRGSSTRRGPPTPRSVRRTAR